MKTDVYTFGSALIDIQLHARDFLFDEMDIKKGNMYLINRFQQEKILGKIFDKDLQTGGKLHTAPGGSASNTVFGISQLGGKAALCGKVADDSFGELYIKYMKDSGVSFNKKKVAGTTGTCIVLISDDAQRTMLTCLGVSSEIEYGDVDEDQLKQSEYIYIEGYLFDSEVATKTILKAVDTARKNNVKIALTASDSFCVERHRDLFMGLIKDDVDLLFANAQEAQALSNTDDTAKAVGILSEICQNLAVTDGSRGSILSFNGQVYNIQPFIATALDTTGAGDSYAAGLLFGLTHGYSVEDSGKIASFYASRVVSQIGPRYAGDIRKEMISLKLEKNIS